MLPSSLIMHECLFLPELFTIKMFVCKVLALNGNEIFQVMKIVFLMVLFKYNSPVLCQAETRAEFAERSVAKLEKTIDDLEGMIPSFSLPPIPSISYNDPVFFFMLFILFSQHNLTVLFLSSVTFIIFFCCFFLFPFIFPSCSLPLPTFSFLSVLSFSFCV